MLLKQLALDALKLMFTNYEYDLDLALNDSEVWDTVLADENYGSYLVNVLPAVNRAFDRIQAKRIQTKVAYFTKVDGNYSCTFDTQGGSFVQAIADASIVYEPYSFKSGYKCTWYNGAAIVTFPLTLVADTTLTAHWTAGYSVYKNYRRFTLPTDLYRIKRVIFENDYDIVADADYQVENDKILVADRVGEYRLLYVPKITRLTPPVAWDTDIDLPEELLALIPYFIKSELYEEDEPQMAAQARNLFEASLDALLPIEESKQTMVEKVYASNSL
jgi:hypothetical protein